MRPLSGLHSTTVHGRHTTLCWTLAYRQDRDEEERADGPWAEKEHERTMQAENEQAGQRGWHGLVCTQARGWYGSSSRVSVKV